KFSEKKEDYLKRIGEKDEEGYLLKEGFFRKNSKESGHYHSNWLSMMYPRLFLAKNLLRDDGVIFVHIDDNEVHNLRLIMNEIFGEENNLDRGILTWINKGSTKGFNRIVKNHEYILAYGRQAENVNSLYGKNYPDKLAELEHYCYNAPNPGNPTCEITFPAGLKIYGKENVDFEKEVGDEVKLEIVSQKMEFKNGELVNDVILRGSFPYRNQIEKFFKNILIGIPTLDYKGQEWEEIFFNSKGLPRYRKKRNTLIISSVIDESEIPNFGSEDIKELFIKKEIFTFPKPVQLVKHILKFFTTDTDIIIDFFAGSATTAQAVLELNKEDGGNRKFILVQLPEKCAEESEAYKAGYKTIAEIAKERIRRVIRKLTSPPTPLQMERGDKSGKYFHNLFMDASPTIFENAHQLRLTDKTEAEEKLWQQLRNRKVENCKFRRQHPLGKFIADFYCHENKLVIEVDGGYHNEKEQQEHDEARTQVINEFGISVMRFTNDEVLNNIKSVIEKITNAL
ncbi:MAG: DUF559 domain-containing protein, partial [Ignavibacteria bacterium]|nr:DUF559 domain-containing protein [Ignavibacteria bacterium]